MASDSFFEEMEPRISRPTVKLRMDEGLQILGQVSEPSLFNPCTASPFSESFNPQAEIQPASPVRCHGFIPQLTPIATAVRTPKPFHSPPTNTNMILGCACKSTLPTSVSPIMVASPTCDPEIREMIQDQNQQLQLLRKQVEQLLQYQEKLMHEKTEGKGRAHESTQTSLRSMEPSNPQMLPKLNSCSPLRRGSQDRTEMTLTFRDLQLETIMERSQNESPDSSIYVNMQEFQDSMSDRQTDGSVANSCGTIMDQVHRLLAQADCSENKQVAKKNQQEKNIPIQVQENPVRKVTMQRVQELGISFITPAISSGSRSSAYPRCNPQKPSHLWDSRKETDQSVEMQRLAEKYLGRTRPNEVKVVDRSNKTVRSVELSMTSQQYLERYGLQVESYSPR